MPDPTLVPPSVLSSIASASKQSSFSESSPIQSISSSISLDVNSSKVTSTSSISPQSPHGSNSVGAGALAGVAIGCLIVGVILASFLLTFFMGRRYRSKFEKMQNRWDAERREIESNDNAKSLYYLSSAQMTTQNPIAEAKIEEANKKIKQLEQERNAASQFGDTLDRHSEQDLLTSSTFGLYTFDQILKQAVMALSVSSSGAHQASNLSKGSLTCCSPDQVAFLRRYDLKSIQANFENVLLHLINGFLYEKICVPFSPYTEASQDKLLNTIHKSLQTSYDQGILARWRCLTQKALRLNQEDKTRKKQSLTNELSQLIIEVLVWSGMDDKDSAEQNVMKNNQRLNLAIGALLSLLDVMHEEMSSSNYELSMVEREGLTKTFGMIASKDQKSRIIVQAATA